MVKGLRQRFREWREAKSGVDAVAIFRRLYMVERVFLVILCVAAVIIVMGGMFSSNVIPHYRATFNADGSLNSGELTKSLDITGNVVLLACLSLLWFARWIPLSAKVLMLCASALMLHGNIKNSAGIQARDREARNAPYVGKNAEIDRLDKRIEGLQKTWEPLKDLKNVKPSLVADTKKALDDMRQSADAECHYGTFGRTRGEKCRAAEAKRDDKSAEVTQYDLIASEIERRGRIETELTRLREERKALGEPTQHVDAELDTMKALYADAGAPSMAAFATKHDSMIEAITMDVKVVAFLGPSLMSIFWFFGLVSANRGEVERNMIELAKDIAEERAKIVLSDTPQAQVAPVGFAAQEMEPDQSEKSVLEIEGRDPPAFVHDPQTTAEAVAAEFIKADPDRPAERKARRKQPARGDSVTLYIKECTVERPGRFVPSKEMISGYKRWCEARNLTPVHQNTFGKVIRNECPHIVAERDENGRTRYHGIGLRNNLRVVAA